MLLGSGALKARKPNDGRSGFELVKGAFPEPDSPDDWVDRQNAKIREEVATTEAMWAHGAKAAADARAIRDAPILNGKRADFLFMMKEAELDSESLAARIEAAVETAVEKAVDKALHAHGVLETDAGNGPQTRRGSILRRRHEHE